MRDKRRQSLTNENVTVHEDDILMIRYEFKQLRLQPEHITVGLHHQASVTI
jgi:hypothetical protein